MQSGVPLCRTWPLRRTLQGVNFLWCRKGGWACSACCTPWHRPLSVDEYLTMPAPRALVLRAPGTNCDVETEYAFQLAGAVPERVHINRLIENPALAARYQILCIPGGFSYGDDIAAGRILATRMRRHLS